MASISDIQTVTLSGTGFRAGLTATLADPDGKVSVVAASRISVASATKLSAKLKFPSVGTYQLRLVSADGASQAVSIPVSDTPSPVVASSAPSSLVLSKTGQWVTFYGSGFRQNISLTLTTPATTGSQVYSGFSIRNVTANSFEAELLLPRDGAYSLTVNDPDEVRSKPYLFEVGRVVSQLSVSSVGDGDLFASPNAQMVRVKGAGFQSGVSVLLTNPDGSVTLAGSSLVYASAPEQFDIFLPLYQEGSYQVVVINPDGGQSTPLLLNVGPKQTALEISSVAPSVVVAGAASQRISVQGTLLSGDFYLRMVEPHGASSLYSSYDIANRTASGFDVNLGFPEPGTYLLRLEQGAYVSPTVAIRAVASFTGPGLVSFEPSVVTANPYTQTLTLKGVNLQVGLSAVLAQADGSGSTPLKVDYSGDDPVVQVTLPVDGSYLLQVTNPDGQKSNWLPLTVGAASPLPAITSVEPFALTAGAELRTVVLHGINFPSALFVRVTLPDATQLMLTKAQLNEVTAFSLVFSLPFAQAGTYQFEVVGADLGVSAPFPFVVAPASVPPAVVSYAPVALQTSLVAQNVSITGSGFLAGLSLVLTTPDGQVDTIAAGSISSVTATGFVFPVVLPSPGTYLLQVMNPDGTASLQFPLVVTAALSHPNLTSCNYFWQQYNGSTRIFTLQGEDLQPGVVIRVSLKQTVPQIFSGLTLVYDGTTQVRFLVGLLDAGRYELTATNPDGQRSPAFYCSLGVD